MEAKTRNEYEKHYGCVAVKAGSEKKVATMITNMYPEVEAYAISQVKHKSVGGIASHVSCIMVPGYIIFCTSEYHSFTELMTIQSVHRILTYDDNSWSLKDNDLFCAKWVAAHNGTVGISTVFWKVMKSRLLMDHC